MADLKAQIVSHLQEAAQDMLEHSGQDGYEAGERSPWLCITQNNGSSRATYEAHYYPNHNATPVVTIGNKRSLEMLAQSVAACHAFMQPLWVHEIETI